MARIVVVEDDVYMREELIDMLGKAGYDAFPLLDFEDAVSQIKELSPDLILLDINLPFHSGFEICKEIKAKQLGTVLILTARDKLQDELHALGLGADDYLTKPCNMERLLARTKNLLRRREEQVQQGLLDGGGFLLDPNTFTLYAGKTSYVLPQNEGKILLALLKNSPNLVSKSELFHTLWGTAEFIDENALLLILAFIVSCCACTSDPVQSQPATPAEVIGKMQTALGQTPCTKAQTVVDLVMTLDGGENGTLDLATKTTTDMTISQEPVSGYTVATVDVNYGGETSQTITENYTVIEDGEAIAYILSSGIWLRMPSGQTAEDYADSASSVAFNSSNVTIDESITQWNGTEVICLTSQLTGQDMQAVLTGVLNNFSALLTDSSVIQTADYSSIACENKLYLNKETHLPMAYELTFSGLNDVLNPMFAEIGATVDVSNCTASATFLSFDTQNEVVVPDGAKEKAEAWSRLLAEEPDNGDGTFTIRESMAIVDIVAPEGFEVTDKGYDHVYFKRDDKREIKYTMWYGGGSERFMSENDSRLNRYGNLPRDISREQMELAGDTLTFEADILGVTWESYEEGVMNAWAFLGNDGTTDYYIFIEVTDGYNDGLGGVKSADVTPDEFMAYLNAISISDLISE